MYRLDDTYATGGRDGAAVVHRAGLLCGILHGAIVAADVGILPFTRFFVVVAVCILVDLGGLVRKARLEVAMPARGHRKSSIGCEHLDGASCTNSLTADVEWVQDIGDGIIIVVFCFL